MNKRMIPMMILSLVYFLVSCSDNSHLNVLVIKAAGYIEEQKPAGPDAITEATSFGRNVHVVSERLIHDLQQKNMRSAIVVFNDSSLLDSLVQRSVDLIVFSGPSYSSRFPKQLQEMVLRLKQPILDEKTICTGLTTCRFLDSGECTIQAFDRQLKELGIQALDGLVIHHEYEDKNWEARVQEFADRIQSVLEK